jgi:AraC-like DNA-binding protein
LNTPLERVQQEYPGHLTRLLGLPDGLFNPDPQTISRDVFGLELERWQFFVACRGSGSSPSVALAIERLRAAPRSKRREVLLVAVPYMGEAGQELCDQAGMGWLDLSGNAHIEAPGLRIHVEGKPNLFKQRGRPANPFAAKSARVTRYLLNHHDRPWLQKEIAAETGLTPTYVSRVVRRLEEVRLLKRDVSTRAVHPRDPNFLLDAWAERYRFDGHRVLKGHVTQPSTDALLGKLVDTFEALDLPYAVTALASAWLRDQFAQYRVTTVYLRSPPRPRLLEDLTFREGSRGANLWIVTPNDEGVFQDSEEIAGVTCVSAVQTYLDLLAHAERAQDAAEHLRERHLDWSKS